MQGFEIRWFMAGTNWGNFWQPVVRLLINEAELNQIHGQIDWQQETSHFTDPQIIYPKYYEQQNFLGMAGGYLESRTAVAYDRLTPYLLPPHEHLIRQGLLDRIGGIPQRILDMGCGTGSTTLLLQQKFPQASITGLDLSPSMLVMAHQKAKATSLKIHWQHSSAEYTGFPSGYFDLITISLLFHETPIPATQAIIKECFRLLKGGGQVVILDSSQQLLRQIEWFAKAFPEVVPEIFPETYMQNVKNYAAGSLDAWLGAAGFGEVRTHDLWLVHQVTSGGKPQSAKDRWAYPGMEINDFNDFLGGFAT